ncbi:ABC transporter permease, partial [Streptomyces sp. SID12501]|nr:ABC transporter permease [Streptomyces sp. SID12501]
MRSVSTSVPVVSRSKATAARIVRQLGPDPRSKALMLLVPVLMLIL